MCEPVENLRPAGLGALLLKSACMRIRHFRGHLRRHVVKHTYKDLLVHSIRHMSRSLSSEAMSMRRSSGRDSRFGASSPSLEGVSHTMPQLWGLMANEED